MVKQHFVGNIFVLTLQVKVGKVALQQDAWLSLHGSMGMVFSQEELATAARPSNTQLTLGSRKLLSICIGDELLLN